MNVNAPILTESVRIPLHELQADVDYLIGRVVADGSAAPMIAASIKDKLAKIEAALIQPQRMPVAWRWRHVNDPNFAWHYQETAIGNANEYLQVEPLYACVAP